MPKCPGAKIIRFTELVKELEVMGDCSSWDIVADYVERGLVPSSTCSEPRICSTDHEILYIAECLGVTYLLDLDTAWIIKLANGSRSLDEIVLNIINKYAEPSISSNEVLKQRAMQIICAIGHLTRMRLISWIPSN